MGIISFEVVLVTFRAFKYFDIIEVYKIFVPFWPHHFRQFCHYKQYSQINKSADTLSNVHIFMKFKLVVTVTNRLLQESINLQMVNILSSQIFQITFYVYVRNRYLKLLKPHQ